MTMEKIQQKHPAQILIVDDDDGIRRLVYTLLTNAGYQADTVEDALYIATEARDRAWRRSRA